MLQVLVQSALENKCLSVESEGLIRQVLAIGSCDAKDINALKELQEAIQAGEIIREAQNRFSLAQFALV
ncbi:MAG: hypothetical protein KME43_22305 [Myxacorys chilensis ATA2-1-KO14]|jgi:hypothetical protein|nr:hypothetical protein [Myxacorys chilensis ATA2-1-KO14]